MTSGDDGGSFNPAGSQRAYERQLFQQEGDGANHDAIAPSLSEPVQPIPGRLIVLAPEAAGLDKDGGRSELRNLQPDHRLARA